MKGARRGLCLAMAVFIAAFSVLSALPMPERPVLGGRPRELSRTMLIEGQAVSCAATATYSSFKQTASLPAYEVEGFAAVERRSFVKTDSLFTAHADSILRRTINNPRSAPHLSRLLQQIISL